MKRAEFEAALARYEEELRRQDAKRSTGSTGKLYDVLVRDYILKQGICRLSDVRCRKGGKVDAGRRGIGNFEVKTGSGPVCYGHGFTTADLVAENVCAGADYVVWAPFPRFLSRNNFPGMFWVFTREDFLATLEAIGKKGIRSSIHVTYHGAQINIQTISTAMEERLWEELENFQTLEEWKESLE